jgi:hypothetical protein
MSPLELFPSMTWLEPGTTHATLGDLKRLIAVQGIRSRVEGSLSWNETNEVRHAMRMLMGVSMIEDGMAPSDVAKILTSANTMLMFGRSSEQTPDFAMRAVPDMPGVN